MTNESRMRTRQPSGRPNSIDVHVGKRLRLLRMARGFSQEKLGEALGLTFQQVQKYERGANRIGASRLYELSRVLEVPVGFFFDEMLPRTESAFPRQQHGLKEPQPLYVETAIGDRIPNGARETLELVRAYHSIGNPKLRKSVFELTKSLCALRMDEATSPKVARTRWT